MWPRLWPCIVQEKARVKRDRKAEKRAKARKKETKKQKRSKDKKHKKDVKGDSSGSVSDNSVWVAPPEAYVRNINHARWGNDGFDQLYGGGQGERDPTPLVRNASNSQKPSDADGAANGAGSSLEEQLRARLLARK